MEEEEEEAEQSIGTKYTKKRNWERRKSLSGITEDFGC